MSERTIVGVVNYAAGVASGMVWYGHSLTPLEPWFWIILLLIVATSLIDAACAAKESK